MGPILSSAPAFAASTASSVTSWFPASDGLRTTGLTALTAGSVPNAAPWPSGAGPSTSRAGVTRRSAPAWKSAWSSCERRQVTPAVTESTPTAIAITSSSAGPA